MQTRIIWAMALLNVLLVAILLGQTLRDNTAMAQSLRRPPTIVAIPGTSSSEEDSAGVVYLLDTSNGRLSGMFYDNNRKAIAAMPPIDLNRIFESAMAPRPAGRR